MNDEYQTFLEWCAAASNADIADDHALIDSLCCQGIGPDWRND